MDAEVERLRKKVENYPSPSSYNRLAELLRNHGQIDDAETICKRSMRDFPRNGQAYVILAGIEQSRGNLPQAKNHLNKAIQNDSRCTPAHMALAEIAQQEGDTAQALRLIQTVVSIRPKDEQAKVMLAQLQGSGTAAVRNPASAPVQPPASRNAHTDSAIVDLSASATGLTSIQPNAVTPSASPRPSAPPPRAPAPAAPAPNRRDPAHALDTFVQTDGVRCAIIADKSGRCVATRNLPNGLDDLVAALANEIGNIANHALEQIGSSNLTSWTITAESGQVLSFNEKKELGLIAIANAEVKVAMLELRARQAILDLGASS